MKTLITADLHLNNKTRDAYRFDFFDWLVPYIVKNNVHRLMVLGDVTDQKDSDFDMNLVNDVVDVLWRISRKVKVIILRGNHDYIDPNSPFFAFLARIDNIQWINNPTTDGSLSEGCLFLPHTYNYKKDWEGINLKSERLIFAHNTFQGAKIGTRTLDGIPTDIFHKHTAIVSGDIHTAQEFGPITYVGAPYIINFGDLGDPRVLIMDGKRFSSVPVPGPRKIVLDIEMSRGVPVLTESTRYQDFEQGDIMKINVFIEPKDAPRWAEIKDKVRAWGDRNKLVINSIHPIMAAQGRQQGKRKELSQKTDESLLKEYAKSRDVDESTLKAGLSLLERN